MTNPAPRHWQQIAVRWSHLGPPLRPSPAVVAHYRELVEGSGGSGPCTALVLGVTPELHGLPWPAGSRVFGADQSEEMIGFVWPGGAGTAIHGDWLKMEEHFEAESLDHVLTDGGFSLLRPDKQEELAGVVCRLLKPGGRFVIRHFAGPEVREPVSSVWSSLEARQIRNIHELKLRLCMAFQESPEAGVCVGDVYRGITERFGEPDALGQLHGWPREEVGTLDTYRDSSNHFHYMTERGMVGSFERMGLRLVGRRCDVGATEARLPILCFSR